MADNSTISSGDSIRDLARQSGTVKTQVMQIDAGGASANAEVLITAGQQNSAYSLPVAIASDQDPRAILGANLSANLKQLQLIAAQPGAGFVPMEIPAFLAG